MASNKHKLEWRIEVDTKTGQVQVKELAKAQDKSTKAMKRQEKAAKSLKGSMSGLYKALGAGAAAYGAVKLYRTVGEWEELTGIQEVAERQMKQAMISSGRYSDQAFANMKDIASALQGVTTFGDEATMMGVKFLYTYKDISDDLMPRTIKAMQDLSALTGGDLATSANIMGKASMGMTGQLARYGITVNKATYEAEGFAGILREMETQIKGQAEALRSTRKGELEAFGNTVGDVKEKLGDFSLSVKTLVAKDVLEDLNRLDKHLSDMQGSEYEKWVEDTANKVIIFKDALLAMGKAAGWTADRIKEAAEAYARFLYGPDTQSEEELHKLNAISDEMRKVENSIKRVNAAIAWREDHPILAKMDIGDLSTFSNDALAQALRDDTAELARLTDDFHAQQKVLADAVEGEKPPSRPEPPAAHIAPTTPQASGGDSSPTKAALKREEAIAKLRQDLAQETAETLASINMGEYEFKQWQVEQEAALRRQAADGDKAALQDVADWRKAQMLELSQAEADARTSALEAIHNQTLQYTLDEYDFKRAMLAKEIAEEEAKAQGDADRLAAIQEYKKEALGAIDQEQAEARAATLEALHEKTLQLTLDEFDFKRAMLDREIEMEQEKAEGDMERMDALHAYKLAQLDAIDKAEADAAENKKKIGESEVGDFANNLRAMGKHSKAAFAAYKAASIAQAIIKTHEAATGAYAALAGIPVVGPALASAAAAAAVAAGMANVANIQQQQPPAYGDGGISWGPEYALVGEKGPEAHVPLKGGNIPVKLSGGGQQKVVNLNMTFTGNNYESAAARQAHMEEVGEMMVRKFGPDVIVENFQNDGDVRAVLGGADL